MDIVVFMAHERMEDLGSDHDLGLKCRDSLETHGKHVPTNKYV
jgi:hypothetical protein